MSGMMNKKMYYVNNNEIKLFKESDKYVKNLKQPKPNFAGHSFARITAYDLNGNNDITAQMMT